MPIDTRPNIATHFLRYTLGNVLVMVAGFVSFPIMARLLDYHQYGLLGVFDSALLLLAAIFKLGSPHSILRFYPHLGGEGAFAKYGANFILLPFLGSCMLWVATMLVFACMPQLETYAHDATGWVALFTLLPAIWISSVTTVMFAEERSELNVLVNVGWRWLNVFAILGVVFFISRSALGVYVARLGVVLVMAAALTVWFSQHGIPTHWRDRDKTSLWVGVRYGVPLMANEISSILLVSVDRLMLDSLTGSLTQVGIYTIGSSLALQVSVMLNSSLDTVYSQVSIRQFETVGVAAVLRTKRAILHILTYLVVAMLVGLATVGSDAFLLLSGRDKAESAPIFVWMCAIFVLNGLFHLCGAGLQLYKRTMTVFAITLAGGLLNIALNLSFIPHFGVMGAVYATAVTYICLILAKLFACPRALLAWPRARAVLIASGAGLLAWLVAHYSGLFGVHSHLGRLVVMMAIMTLVFLPPALTLDRTLRTTLVDQWNKLRVRFA